MFSESVVQIKPQLLDPNDSEKRPLTLSEATYHVHTDVLRILVIPDPFRGAAPIAISGITINF